MPIYTFKCNKCKKTIEVLQNIEDFAPLCNCSKKNIPMNRLMPLTGKPKFSGSGFYETDYKKNKKSIQKKNGSKDKKND